MKLKLKVWQHFERFTNASGEIRGKCKYCGNNFACHPVVNGTSVLNNHMKSCEEMPRDDNTQSHLMFKADDQSKFLTTWKFDQDDIRKSLAQNNNY